MRPERSAQINGQLIEEYYWAGEFIVYVNNQRFNGTFDEACERARRKAMKR